MKRSNSQEDYDSEDSTTDFEEQKRSLLLPPTSPLAKESAEAPEEYYKTDKVIKIIMADLKNWGIDEYSLDYYGIECGPRKEGYVYMSGYNIPQAVINGPIPRRYIMLIMFKLIFSVASDC